MARRPLIVNTRHRSFAEQEGGALLLLNQLAKLCGPLPEEVQQRVHRLPFEQMSALGEALLGFRTLADLQAWLDANECPGG